MSAKNKSIPSTTSNSTSHWPKPTRDDIAICAMAIWEAEGRPEGQDVRHWLLAEQRLRVERQAEVCDELGDAPRRSVRGNFKRGRSAGVVL